MSDKNFTKEIIVTYEVRPVTFYEIHRTQSNKTDGPPGTNIYGGGWSSGMGWSNGEYGLFKTEKQAESIIALLLADEK